MRFYVGGESFEKDSMSLKSWWFRGTIRAPRFYWKLIISGWEGWGEHVGVDWRVKERWQEKARFASLLNDNLFFWKDFRGSGLLITLGICFLEMFLSFRYQNLKAEWEYFEVSYIKVDNIDLLSSCLWIFVHLNLDLKRSRIVYLTIYV